MKKLLTVAVFITALFAAQSANRQINNNDVAVKTPSLERSIQFAQAEVKEVISAVSGGNCVSYNEQIQKGKIYERKFENSCNYAVTISYKYKNGGKSVSVSGQEIKAGKHKWLPAGDSNEITEFKEKKVSGKN
jgi:hypothetical protein